MCKACVVALKKSSRVPFHRCFEPNCEQFFFRNKCLIEHLTNVHNKEFEEIEYKFSGRNDFKAWKKKVENVTNSKYTQVGSNEKKDALYYACQKKGVGEPPRKGRKAKGDEGEPIKVRKPGKADRNYTCTSFIQVKMTATEWTVTWQAVHYGHPLSPPSSAPESDPDLVGVVLTKSQKMKIADYLFGGMTPSEILEKESGTIFGYKISAGPLTRHHIDEILANIEWFREQKRLTSECKLRKKREREKTQSEEKAPKPLKKIKSEFEDSLSRTLRSPKKRTLEAVVYNEDVPVDYTEMFYDDTEAVNSLNLKESWPVNNMQWQPKATNNPGYSYNKETQQRDTNYPALGVNTRTGYCNNDNPPAQVQQKATNRHFDSTNGTCTEEIPIWPTPKSNNFPVFVVSSETGREHQPWDNQLNSANYPGEAGAGNFNRENLLWQVQKNSTNRPGDAALGTGNQAWQLQQNNHLVGTNREPLPDNVQKMASNVPAFVDLPRASKETSSQESEPKAAHFPVYMVHTGTGPGDEKTTLWVPEVVRVPSEGKDGDMCTETPLPSSAVELESIATVHVPPSLIAGASSVKIYKRPVASADGDMVTENSLPSSSVELGSIATVHVPPSLIAGASSVKIYKKAASAGTEETLTAPKVVKDKHKVSLRVKNSKLVRIIPKEGDLKKNCKLVRIMPKSFPVPRDNYQLIRLTPKGDPMGSSKFYRMIPKKALKKAI